MKGCGAALPTRSLACCIINSICALKSSVKTPALIFSVQWNSESRGRLLGGRRPLGNGPPRNPGLSVRAPGIRQAWIGRVGQVSLIYGSKTQGHQTTSGSQRRKKRQHHFFGKIDSRIQNIRECSLHLSAHLVLRYHPCWALCGVMWGDADLLSGGQACNRNPMRGQGQVHR